MNKLETPSPRGTAGSGFDPGGGRAGPLYVAVVHATDGVRFAAAAAARGLLIRQLAAYVRRHAGDALWPDHARHVRTLFVRGELEGAVETYFGLVGERWDKEWLVTTVVAPTDDHPGVIDIAAGFGAVAIPEELSEEV